MYRKLVVIALGLSLLLGCSEKQAEQAIQLVEEKYNETFEASHIGERYSTATNDTITTILHPEGKEHLSFKTITTKDGKLIGDGFIPILISEQFNDIMKSELEPLGIESETYTFIMGTDKSTATETDPSITIGEYVEEYKPAYFSAHMIVKDTSEMKGEQFEQALLKAYEASNDTTYQIGIRILLEEEYDEAAKEYRTLPEVKDSWFSDYKVVDEIDAMADENGYNFIFHSDPRYEN